MITTLYLTLEQLLVIHEDQIDRYGGTSGIRDLALLESALFRPQTTFGGKDLYLTIFDKAAALIHSLIQNHSFIDGNKRTGTVASLVFLAMNGWEIKVEQDELVQIALSIATKGFSIDEISHWLQTNSKKIH